MLSYAGVLLVFAACLLFGSSRCESARREIEETRALALLVRQTGESIETFRYPLGRIFADFSNEYLEDTGFIKTLRDEGLSAAIGSCATALTGESLDEVKSFAARLGGESADTQVKLCALVSSRLSERADKLSETLGARLKMYRLLPLLAASSVLLVII